MKKRDWGLSILTVCVCIYIITMLTIAAVTSQIRNNNAKQYPLIVNGYTPEDNQAAERERARRPGDTLIVGPNGNFIIKPDSVPLPDLYGIVRDIDTKRKPLK